MAKEAKAQQAPTGDELSTVDLRASAKALPLPAGLFLFKVTNATPVKVAKTGSLQFPALHVAPGPGCPPGVVEFIGLPRSMGIWLYHPDDKLVVKVEEPGATLILSSLRSVGTEPLNIDVARIDGRAVAMTSSLEAAPTAASKAAHELRPAASADDSLKLQVGMHIRNRGDMVFQGGNWAGLLPENLWVEALAITMQETLTSRDVEYKGLSANGFETPWLSDGAVCGTKGISLPLVGFAIRLKGDATTKYDCEYSGYFQSGTTVGPLKNGVPCRSKTASDPLVGVRLRVVARAGTKAAPEPAKIEATKGPKFSKFREPVKTTAAGPDKKTPARRK